ncbi:MAG: zinc ABC transporter substrate-binding protein [Clostridia bacterium]|nr:zinc ABC transporter substrate-binding protein [Clostridia bacterium]
MKKLVSLVLCLTFLICALAGCSAVKKNDGKLRVIVSIFPVYDWVRNIVGDSDEADVTLLLDSGVDLHSFRPDADDIAGIASADVLICLGGLSDDWVDGVVRSSGNGDLTVVRLLDLLGDRAKEEELVEGMQEEEEEEEGPEYDEHVWLSLKNASYLTERLAEVLAEADPDNGESYKKNAAGYAAKLDELDKEYAEAVAAAPVKTLVFCDRFPFRYLTDDYGITYYAAFAGCSAESEASFETVATLAGKVDELGLRSVIKLETSDGAVAKAVIESTGSKDQQILTMNSLQSATGAGGETYLSVMEDNLKVLKKALN